MVWLGRDLEDFQHLVDSRGTAMDDPHRALMDLAWAMLGFCVWGRETEAGGEETVSGSRGDKQLAPSVYIPCVRRGWEGSASEHQECSPW